MNHWKLPFLYLLVICADAQYYALGILIITVVIQGDGRLIRLIPFTKLYTGNKSYCSYMCWILPGSGVTDSNRVLQRPHVAPFAPSDDFSCFNDMAVRMLNACHPKALLQPVIIIILIICVHQAHASLAAPSAHPLTDIMTRAKKTATPDALRAPNPPNKY
jgi:hypothetical protein